MPCPRLSVTLGPLSSPEFSHSPSARRLVSAVLGRHHTRESTHSKHKQRRERAHRTPHLAAVISAQPGRGNGERQVTAAWTCLTTLTLDGCGLDAQSGRDGGIPADPDAERAHPRLG